MATDQSPTIPATMTAIGIAAPGGPEALVPENRPVPRAGPGEVLVEVAAAGVNRPDILQRLGNYPPPVGASDIPGLEIAGRVAMLGEGASRWKIGDRVCALVAGGGYAPFCAVDATNALPVPEGVDLVAAAAIPETFFTVWTNVFERGALKRGETLLVHGGTSGIGTTAIMLGKAFGARVLATAGSAAKCEAMRRLGADRAIDYRAEDFVVAVGAETGGKGVDLILDMVGGDYVRRNYEAAAVGGRIVQIAFLDGAKAEIDLARLMTKRLTHTGSTLRARGVAEKAAIAGALEEKVWPLVASGAVRPVIHRTFPLAEARHAHALMEEGSHIGKIVLTTDRAP
jgi:NADPH:quinone reductase